ncbi:MAG: hypothetical protein RLZZ123_942 [Pseudomonadota bacterium]
MFTVLLHLSCTFMTMDIPDVVIDDLPPANFSLRICVVTETYPPDVNGVSLTLAKTVAGLRESGHHVFLVRPRHQDHQPQTQGELEQHLVRGVPLPMYRHVRLGLPATRMLKRLWARQRPDLVHIATEGPLGWSALRLALKMKIPVSSDFRTNFHSYSQHYRMGWLRGPILRYLKKFHNSAHCTMVPTQELLNELTTMGFLRLHHVPRGVDTTRFDPAFRSSELRQAWGVDDDTLVLICVSRLAAEKNLELLFGTWRHMLGKGARAKLVLVGDGPLREQWQREHPDVIFAGFQTGEQLSAHYASADLFVFPSQTETFGNVTLEAMASGLAVLAYRCAAAGELIESGVEGVLVDGSAATFMESGWQMSLSVEALRLMGAKGRERALRCSWPQVVAQTEEVMRNITQSTPMLLD